MGKGGHITQFTNHAAECVPHCLQSTCHRISFAQRQSSLRPPHRDSAVVGSAGQRAEESGLAGARRAEEESHPGRSEERRADRQAGRKADKQMKRELRITLGGTQTMGQTEVQNTPTFSVSSPPLASPPLPSPPLPSPPLPLPPLPPAGLEHRGAAVKDGHALACVGEKRGGAEDIL